MSEKVITCEDCVHFVVFRNRSIGAKRADADCKDFLPIKERARWEYRDGLIVCSACGDAKIFGKLSTVGIVFKYCPTCGAKMDKEERNEQ